MKLNTKEFRSVLLEVHPGVDSKGLIQQSDCFVFQDGKVCSFSDEICIRGSSGLEKDFVAAIHAEKLLKFIQQLSHEEMDVDTSGNELILEGQDWKSGFSLQKEIHLPLGLVESPSKWKPLPEQFSEAVSVVGECASDDLSRFETTCVHITPTHVEACDNIQCCRWSLDLDISEPTLVRQIAIKHLPSFQPTHFCETKGWLHFKNKNKTILSARRNPVEKFNNLDSIFSDRGNPFQLPRNEVMESVINAQLFVKDEHEKTISVALKDNRMKLSGSGSRGWFEQSIEVQWDFPPTGFSISPALLLELMKKQSDFALSKQFISMQGPCWKWVGCLFPAREEPTAKRRKKKEEKE